jgi:hypothetical protein
VAHKKPRPASRSIRLEEVGRGCVYNNPEYSREPGFFAIAIEKFFSLRADWHRDDRATPLVRQYQAALDSILQSHPELCECAVSCADCGIRFLTHPRNAGRRNLRCPFGCREHHRRERCCQRSTAYYRTAAGKTKKKRLNARRQSRQAPPAAQPQAASPPPQADTRQADHFCAAVPARGAREPLPRAAELQREDVVLDEASVANSPMLPYVRMVVSLIEGVEFTSREVVDLLRQALRQHSIGAGRGVDYLLGFLDRHPP